MDKELYKKWKSLVNMTPSELKAFMETEEGKEAGLSRSEARAQGIKSGQDSAKAILRMKEKPVDEWNETDWEWCKTQISFISRMRGVKGPLFKDGEKTPKHTALLIWGHNPNKKSLSEHIIEQCPEWMTL